jgi:phosphoglucan,water dikinase
MDDVADKIIEADKTCRSWREKLDFVRGLFAKENSLTTGQLADIAIYLRFLGTGQIRCEEDGRHFRPSHHAGIASEIHERLGRFANTDAAWIARKIYPALPSTAQAFQRAEPLTRIRDIAHRNDIPHELKTEIKTTLQNKLHRCAGPEDLVTSAKLLERITAPGANYSGEFVEQFKIFHEELKEFFNARSLDDQLTALKSKAGGEVTRLIGDFLAAKNSKTPQEQLNTFKLLTQLREEFLAVSKKQSEEAREFLLADIALEDFAFVLLSELLNALESAKTVAWDLLLDALALAIRNLSLSGIETEECAAIESELNAWRGISSPSPPCNGGEGRGEEELIKPHASQMDSPHASPLPAQAGRGSSTSASGGTNSTYCEQLLRIKATTDRAKRIAENFSDRVATLFPPRVEKLGRALGVEERAVRVFCEAEIRGNLVFQLSKLVSMLSRHIREALALPGWDVIVSGRAVGRLCTAMHLEELNSDAREPALVLLKRAEGDEEIPHGVAGIVLAHELPHLSHLGVRARQAGVVLVACEDATKFEELADLRDQRLTLVASAEQFEFTPGAEVRTNGDNKAARIEIPEVEIASARHWLPLEKASPKNSGGKADGARRLAELATRNGVGFKTPSAFVIPFGVMENALRAEPKLESEYRSFINRINDLSGEEFSKALDRLRDLIQQLPVPEEIVAAAKKHFALQSRLMVRSSANCEDLEQLAGAGLYDSIANVAVDELATAIRKVWASLWTQRATLSRKQAGIAHDQAHMAVLIQQMITPEFSFVLHTTNPINGNSRELYAEVAVGLGETLASAAVPGSPYRLVCEKDSDEVTTLSLASFSHALMPGDSGVTRKRLSYSDVPLTRDPAFRKQIGKRLAAVGRFIEEAFGKPQDIEGAVIGDEIYLVQSRAQQGLERASHRSTRIHTDRKEKKARIDPRSSATKERANNNLVCPLTLGLFEKRIDGDDCLLDLARLRFQQTGMGAEMHASNPDHLEWLLKFRPSPESPVTLHLPRDFNLNNPDSRQRVCEFAARFAGRIHGMILHDSDDLANRAADYVGAARELDSRLQQIEKCPFVFVEYAVGLEPEVFANFFKTIRGLKHISACIDVGHVGIRQARSAYAKLHPGEDICALKSQPPNLPQLINDVESATRSPLPMVLELIKSIASLQKPIHFHLHDGHPLSTFSPYGVSDHLSFLAEIPLSFDFCGRRSVPTMFGRDGLFQIVATTLNSIGNAQVSFTLEIHPPDGRTPLGNAVPLFNHWTDKTNAEKMNHWLALLAENHRLLKEAIEAASRRNAVI